MAKHLIAASFALGLSIISIVLFVGLCWTAAADAQGAIALYLFAPVLAILVVSSFLLGRFSSRHLSIGLVSKRLSVVIAIFLIVFYFSPVVGWESFGNSVIGFVAKSFEAISGKSPIAFDKGL